MDSDQQQGGTCFAILCTLRLASSAWLFRPFVTSLRKHRRVFSATLPHNKRKQFDTPCQYDPESSDARL